MTSPDNTLFAGLIDPVLELAISIQQVPAPTFNEARRAAFVQQQFLAEGLSEVSRDSLGNVYARIPGSGGAQPLVVSAHLDTVFPESINLAVRRTAEEISGPGIGDNSLGVAGLFALYRALRMQNANLPGDLWLVANVGEEGLGDLCGMRAVVDRFGEQPLAYLVLEGMSLGQIYNRGLGVRRYRITVRTAGGHSWVDYGSPSAVHELAGLAAHLAAAELPKTPRTTLNIGAFHGGTSVNTVAAEAYLDIDLRSEDASTLDRLARWVDNQAKVVQRPGVEVNTEVVGDRPSGVIDSRHPLVRLAWKCLEEVGIQPRLNIGSTDANIPLSRALPAICLGLTTGTGAHTEREIIHTRPLIQGLAQLTALVKGLYLETSSGRQGARRVNRARRVIPESISKSRKRGSDSAG